MRLGGLEIEGNKNRITMQRTGTQKRNDDGDVVGRDLTKNRASLAWVTEQRWADLEMGSVRKEAEYHSWLNLPVQEGSVELTSGSGYLRTSEVVRGHISSVGSWRYCVHGYLGIKHNNADRMVLPNLETHSYFLRK